MTKEDIFANFIISILGSAITMVAAYFIKFKRLFEESNFDNQKAAEKRIINDICNSKTLKVYAMCGSTFSDSANSVIAQKVLNDPNLEQLYLISDDTNSFINERQNELPKNSANLKTKITNSINDFKSAKISNSRIEYRLHKSKVGFRLIILDKCLYLSQQARGVYGKDTKIQRIEYETPAYTNYLAYFNDLWEKHS